MATPTADEIEKKEAEVQKLREKIADSRAKEAENLRAVERELRLQALQAEEERLQQALDAQQERSKKSVIRDGSERVADQIEEGPTPATPNAPTTTKEG